VQAASHFQAALADPATPAELERFAALQKHFADTFEAVFGDSAAARTVVIVPSLSLDQDVMAKLTGVNHYEERMLCLLLLLRLHKTRVVYVTSTPISEAIIDYYLHLLPGIPGRHARARLTLLSCDDASFAPLTQKILARPRLMEKIRQAMVDPATAHLSCFTVSELERRLALELGIPIYGCDPALQYWGSKSGSRKIFRDAGISLAAGFEDLKDASDVAHALAELKAQKPDLRKAVVKLNEGFSGEGNAVVDLSRAPSGAAGFNWFKENLPNMAYEARGMTWDLYHEKLRAMGGIVEEFIPGEIKTSPSAQFRVNPLGQLDAISTHDQVLGGQSQQIFMGCRFPASAEYRLDIQEQGMRAARLLAEKGALGRFGVDFISVKEGDAWRHVAIEINLRKGGTTHPFLMLQFLTDGHYDAETGQFLTPSGAARCYYASDNIESPDYRGLSPDDLIEIAAANKLHFHAATAEGVAFHLIGALSQFGKLGVVCIGANQARADALFRRTIDVLEAATHPKDKPRT
jgi:hypothetical protein